ncbi:charged multivesicular body protein 2b [Tachysurus ichikawai]
MNYNWIFKADFFACSSLSFSAIDIIKEQTKELRGTQRQISRDRAALEKQEKQMEMEIKKMAKAGNRDACKILAKQLVQLRKQKNRTYAVSSKVTSMSTQTKVMNSQMKMAGAMSNTAKPDLGSELACHSEVSHCPLDDVD